jgi:hypothetical protein
MPLPGTAHCAKISVQFTFGLDGQICENEFYLQDATDAMFANPTATLAVIQAQANIAFLPRLYPGVSLIGCVFEDVRVFPFGGIAVPQVAQPGTRAGSVGSLPSSACIAIKKVTGNLGRSGRGRWYWPLADTNAISGTNDTVVAAYVTTILAGLTSFQGAVEAGLPPVAMGIVSYRTAGAQRAAGLFQQIVSWQNTDRLVDSQRRRLSGRGR